MAMIATAVIAVQVALGLVFDPRYKDFPFAAMTASVVPIALVALWTRAGDAGQGLAERLAAATLALSAVYILFNESVANWQSLWFCGLLMLLSLSLVRFRWPRAAQN
jgi:glucan 1,3-beta-glucosidase